MSTWALPEIHSKLKNLCREFCESELRPVADVLDRQQLFPSDQVIINCKYLFL